MAPKKSKATQQSRSSGRLSVSQETWMKPQLDIEYPERVTMIIEDGDKIMRLAPHIALRRQDTEGSITSEIKHFINPKSPEKWPRLHYDSGSLFIPEEREVPPSEADLTAASWSPHDRYRLKQGESVTFDDTHGNPCTLCPTDANEFVEIVPQSIAVLRPDPRIASIASESERADEDDGFLHVLPLIDDPPVTLDGPRPGWPFCDTIDFGKPLTWVNGKVKRLLKPIDVKRFIDTPSIRSMSEALLAVTTKTPTRRGSTLAETRAAAMSYRATTRASARTETKGPHE
jgi:hypothetical protein